jgi:hypothetical protein
MFASSLQKSMAAPTQSQQPSYQYYPSEESGEDMFSVKNQWGSNLGSHKGMMSNSSNTITPRDGSKPYQQYSNNISDSN